MEIGVQGATAVMYPIIVSYYHNHGGVQTFLTTLYMFLVAAASCVWIIWIVNNSSSESNGAETYSSRMVEDIESCDEDI